MLIKCPEYFPFYCCESGSISSSGTKMWSTNSPLLDGELNESFVCFVVCSGKWAVDNQSNKISRLFLSIQIECGRRRRKEDVEGRWWRNSWDSVETFQSRGQRSVNKGPHDDSSLMGWIVQLFRTRMEILRKCGSTRAKSFANNQKLSGTVLKRLRGCDFETGSV